MTARATAIVEEVLREGEVSVEALAARLGVSLAAVRRDLGALERQGLVRRTHGGATAVSPVAYDAFRYEVHVLITDRDASDTEVRPFLEKGIEVRRA